MDFHGFHGFPLILMVFRGFGVLKFGGAKRQLAAPIETSARFQTVHRFSQIFIDFHRFHGFPSILMVFRGSGVMDAGRG